VHPVDVHTWIGAYPFRHVPHPDPEVLVRVLARERVRSAWVGHLPSAFHRDPAHGNAALYAALAPHAATLLPAPCVRPDWPGWERQLREAVDRGAPVVRAYPPQWGLGPGDRSMHDLAAACGEAGLVLLLTVRFEDLRQRHWMDAAGDLGAAAIRALARQRGGAQLVVAGAGRELVEEVTWGLTLAERERLWWDFSWVWGPPDDHLATLFRTIGADRFVFGTGWPLRLTQNPSANLDLLPDELRPAALAGGDEIVARARSLASRRVVAPT
jgi:predicted TIM-barrel fold metal-dependent hydrolase